MSVWSKFSQSAAASKTCSEVKSGSMASSFLAFPLKTRDSPHTEAEHACAAWTRARGPTPRGGPGSEAYTEVKRDTRVFSHVVCATATPEKIGEWNHFKVVRETGGGGGGSREP